MNKDWKPYDMAKWKTPNSIRQRVVQLIQYPTDGQVGVRMVPWDVDQVVSVKLSDLTKVNKRGEYQYRYLHVAEVWGRGYFPEDMLRYDCAFLWDWTKNEQDDWRLTQDEKIRIYSVRDMKKEPWTHGRWQSFSFYCKHINTIDIRKENVS